MQVEIITDESKFLDLKHIWNPLLQRSGTDTIFLTFEWLSTWWRHFGQGKQLLIVLVKSAEDIVGLAPFMITVRDGFRQVSMIGDKTTDYKDFVIAENQNRYRIIKAIFDALIEEETWNFFRLTGFNEESPNFQPLKTVLCEFKEHTLLWSEYGISPYISIDNSWQSYWNSLRKSFRDGSDRQLRRLKRDKGVVSYHYPINQGEVEIYIDLLIKQHIIRWKETKKLHSIFENLPTVNFYKDLGKQLYEKKWLSLPVQLVNGEITAILMAFEYARKYFYYIPTTNIEFSKYSVGRLLNLHAFESAFAQGLKEVDLLLGDEPYKSDFNPKLRKLYSVMLFQKSLLGHISKWWFKIIRPRLEAIMQKSKHLQRLKMR